jgi:hypothetical protein
MQYKCKGLAAGSLFQFCFVGFLMFGLAAGVFSYIASHFFENWSGPQGETSYSMSVVDKTVTEEQVSTTDGLKRLIVFLVAFPFGAAIIASFLWLYIWLGQFLYTRFKPISLFVTNRGLGFLSSIKICFIGFFFSMTPFFWAGAIALILKISKDSTLAVGEKSFGIGFSIFMAIVLIPLILAFVGLIWGTSLYIGQRIYTIFKPLNYRINEIPANV